MPEKMTISQPSRKVPSLLEYFLNPTQKSVPLSILQQLKAISTFLQDHSIDDETAVAIAQSYEARNGRLDDAHLRVSRFRTFVEAIPSEADPKQTLIDTVKTLGYLSKNELEEYAKDTGDWSQFLKRSSEDAKNEQP